MAAMATAKKMAGMHPDIGSGPMMGYEGTAGSGRARGPGPAVEFRSLVFELRAEGPDGRTLIGRAVPYLSTATLSGGRTERFLPGAFAEQVNAADQWGQVRIYDSHASRIDQRPAVGKTTLLSDRPDGLYGEWHLYGTGPGNDALELVRTGEVTGLSIGFRPKSTRRGADGALERHSAHLDHIALTTDPTYADAAVTGLRSSTSSPRPVQSFRRDLDVALGIMARLDAGR
jgi:HK97 family phage prohead protease